MTWMLVWAICSELLDFRFSISCLKATFTSIHTNMFHQAAAHRYTLYWSECLSCWFSAVPADAYTLKNSRVVHSLQPLLTPHWQSGFYYHITLYRMDVYLSPIVLSHCSWHCIPKPLWSPSDLQYEVQYSLRGKSHIYNVHDCWDQYCDMQLKEICNTIKGTCLQNYHEHIV